MSLPASQQLIWCLPWGQGATSRRHTFCPLPLPASLPLYLSLPWTGGTTRTRPPAPLHLKDNMNTSAASHYVGTRIPAKQTTQLVMLRWRHLSDGGWHSIYRRTTLAAPTTLLSSSRTGRVPILPILGIHFLCCQHTWQCLCADCSELAFTHCLCPFCMAGFTCLQHPRFSAPPCAPAAG